MWLRPILPRLTERELRDDIARFDPSPSARRCERGNDLRRSARGTARGPERSRG